MKRGVGAVGVEQNPIAYFASRTKTNWEVDAETLRAHARNIAQVAYSSLESDGFQDSGGLPLFSKGKQKGLHLKTLPAALEKLVPKNAISPYPLHRALVLLETIESERDPEFEDLERLALARGLVEGISNLRFGPEIGLGKIRDDAPVISIWLRNMEKIANDLQIVSGNDAGQSRVILGDARKADELLEEASVDAVITSPPYPNEKDYTRSTRLESVLLGFILNRDDLRNIKTGLLRSNTRNVYKNDTEDNLIGVFPRIVEIANNIEKRRIELGKTSGFERLYPRVVGLYFGGLFNHLAGLRRVLKPGANLAYVVGDQASYLRVHIPTGQLLADIAKHLGYEVLDLELFRKRLSTATGDYLREEVLMFRWTG